MQEGGREGCEPFGVKGCRSSGDVGVGQPGGCRSSGQPHRLSVPSRLLSTKRAEVPPGHCSVPCSRKPLDFSPWQGTPSSSSLGGILLKLLPSNGSALRGPGDSDSPGRELGQEATMLLPAPGRRWLQPGHTGSSGGLCACRGTGMRSHSPGQSQPSAWQPLPELLDVSASAN